MKDDFVWPNAHVAYAYFHLVELGKATLTPQEFCEKVRKVKTSLPKVINTVPRSFSPQETELLKQSLDKIRQNFELLKAKFQEQLTKLNQKDLPLQDDQKIERLREKLEEFKKKNKK